MRVTRRKRRRGKKQARIRRGPALVTDLAHFLNLDLAKCDIEKYWHYFDSWRVGIPTSATDADLKRYEDLKLLVTLLEERDIQPQRPDFIKQLQSLQDEIKAVLKPILRTSLKANERNDINYGIRHGMEVMVAQLNRCTLTPTWALYADNLRDKSNSLQGWHCTYDPERPNDVTKVDGVVLSQSNVLHLGDYRFVVKESLPRSNSIADRLFWFVGQTLIDGSISRLKTCVECKKYFSSYDSKQVVCGASECRVRHNRKGTAERVRRLRKRQAKKRKN
jgi:hypothetical protein